MNGIFLDSTWEKQHEFERLADIGKATEKAFGFSECDDYLGQCNITHEGKVIVTGEMWGSVEDLLEWAKED